MGKVFESQSRMGGAKSGETKVIGLSEVPAKS